MVETTGRRALITGASSGIGKELARLHAGRGGSVILVARSKDKLDVLAAEFQERYQVQAEVIPADLSEPDAAKDVFDTIRSRGLSIDYLINNAGFGGRGLFHERDWETDHAMIQLNVVALTALTRFFLPFMVQRGSGRIMNVASMAGFLPGPLQAVYYATKAYVLSFSEAVAEEVRGTGVTVTALCPGATHTGFSAVADLEGTPAFQHFVADARSVAEEGYDAMLRGKAVIVPGAMNKVAIHGLLRLAPRRLAAKVARATMERKE